jgi:hypothetical protein
MDKAILGLPDHFRNTDKKYFDKIRIAIKDTYLNSNDIRSETEQAREQLSKLELDKLFKDKNADGLKELAKNYASNMDWQ